MKYILLVTMIVAMTTKITGQLTCNTCSWSFSSTSNSQCFNGAGSINKPTCSSTSQNNYCQTMMTIRDGIVISINRRCAAGASDFDQSTNLMPPKNKCITQISTGATDVENSECYFSCNTNNCNTVNPKRLKLCSVNCGSYGRCDYISGTCVCNSGYTGANCGTAPTTAPATFMSCIQCDQETDSTCPDMTSGTPCSSTSHKYCSTTMVTTFDKNGNKVRSSITKACSASYVASDECFISKRSDVSYSTDVEYTCATTCDVNNCNTKLPDGLITGNEAKQPIRCIQCSSDTSTSNCARGNMPTTVCPSSATYCKSVASYYFSERSDATYQVEPDYQMINIVRSCSNSAVTRDCSSVKVGVSSSSLNMVTCQETCEINNCNDGWPARPKCSQCTGVGCTSSPLQPTQCPQPYQRYCTLQEINKAIDSSETFVRFGYSQTTIRDCSYHGIGTKCVTNSYGDGKSENCNKTCETDGCNLGSSSAGILTGSILLTFFFMIVGRLVL